MDEIKKGFLKDFNDNIILPHTTQDQVEGLEASLSAKQDLIDEEHKLSADLIDGDLGTTVEANPEDEATESLSKIKIDDTVYTVSADNVIRTDIEEEQTIKDSSGYNELSLSPYSIGLVNDSGYYYYTISMKTAEGSEPYIYVQNDNTAGSFYFDCENDGILATQDWVELWAEEKAFNPVYGDYDGDNWTRLTIGDETHDILQVSGDNDGTNWTSLTIGEETYNISHVSGEYDNGYGGATPYWTEIKIGDDLAYLHQISAEGDSDNNLTSITVDGNTYSINAANVSGENDGTNWTQITIGDETYDIPQGSEGSDSNYTLDFECTPYLLGHKIVNATEGAAKSISVNTDVSTAKVEKILIKLCDTLAESETSYIAGTEPSPSTPKWARKIIVNKPNVEFLIEGLYGTGRPNRDLLVRSSGYSVLLATDAHRLNSKYYQTKVMVFVSGETTITKINDVEADPIILTEPGWYEFDYCEDYIDDLSQPVDFEITNKNNSGIYTLSLGYSHLSVSSTSLKYNELLREFLNWGDRIDSSTEKFEYNTPKSKLTLLNKGVEKDSLSLEELQDNLVLKPDAVNGIKTISKTVLQPLDWNTSTNKLTLRNLSSYSQTDKYRTINNTLNNAVWPDDDIVFNNGSVEIHINRQTVSNMYSSNSSDNWLRIQFIKNTQDEFNFVYYYSLSNNSFYINTVEGVEGFDDDIYKDFLVKCSDINLQLSSYIKWGIANNWYITNEIKEALSYLFGYDDNSSYIDKDMISLTTQKGTINGGVPANNSISIVSDTYYLSQTPLELKLNPSAYLDLMLKGISELPVGLIWDAPSSSLTVSILEGSHFYDTIVVSYIDKLNASNSIVAALLNGVSWCNLIDSSEIDAKSFTITVAGGGEYTNVAGEVNRTVSIILANSISSKGQKLSIDSLSYNIPTIKGKNIFKSSDFSINTNVGSNIAVPDSLSYLERKASSEGRLPNLNDTITKLYGGVAKDDDLIKNVMKDIPCDQYGTQHIKLFTTDGFEFWLDYQDASSFGMDGYVIYLSDGSIQTPISYISCEYAADMYGIENNSWCDMSSEPPASLSNNFNLLSAFGYDGSQELTVTEVADDIAAFTGFISIEPFEEKTIKGLALTDEGVATQSSLIPIKTINGQEIIGDGDIHIEGGEVDPEQIYSIIEQAMKPLSEQVQKLTVCLDYVSQAHNIQFSNLEVYDLEEEQTLRFTIEEDMTWREFVESSFNTEGWTINDNDEIEVGDGRLIWLDDNPVASTYDPETSTSEHGWVRLPRRLVTADETIINAELYVMYKPVK